MTYDPSASRAGSVFSDNPQYQSAVLCYINGVEVPIVGFTLSYGVWQIPSFQIQMVPDVSIERLGTEDRVTVAIFYLDYWADPLHPEFRLLCDGEIVGWSWSFARTTRTMGFQCLAHISIFQALYFFFMTNVDDIVAAQAPEVSASSLTPTGALLYPYALFHRGLLASPAQLNLARPPSTTGGDPATETAIDQADTDAPAPDKPIQAPYELVYNVVKGVIDSRVPASLRAVPQMNFFARWIRKTNFHNRWVRLPILEDPDQLANRHGVFPIFQAVRNNEALIAMQRLSASSQSNNGPIWNLLQSLLSDVFMEIAMIPNPACLIATLQPATATPPAAGSPPPPPPPPGEDNSLPAQDGKIIGILGGSTPVTAQLGPNAATIAPTDSAAINMQAASLAAQIRSALQAGTAPSDSLLAQAGFTVTPTDPNEVSAPAIALYLRTQALIGALNTVLSADVGLPPTTPARLGQYFVKPKMLFGIPPHCNAFFPSMQIQWGGEENYLSQPTRLYVNDSVMTRLLRGDGRNPAATQLMLHALTVGWPPEAEAVLHHHLASIEDSSGGSSAGAQESGRNMLVWPEEFFKGPVVARMELPSWFQTLMQFHSASAAETRPQTNGLNLNHDVAPVAPVPTTPGRQAPAGTSSTSQTPTNRVTSGTSGAGATAPTDVPSSGQPTPSGGNAPSGQAFNPDATTYPGIVMPAAALPAQSPPTTLQLSTPTARSETATNYPFRWYAPSSVLSAGNSATTYDRPPTFQEAGTYQLPIYPGTRFLKQYLSGLQGAAVHTLVRRNRVYVPASGLTVALFPQISEVYDHGSNRMVNPNHLDMHQSGRCLDLGIGQLPTQTVATNPRVRGDAPNLVLGSPLANWLVQNAAFIGVQLVIWGRSVWTAKSGTQFTHYTGTGQPVANFDHFNHVHVEFTVDCANMETPFFQQNNITKPQGSPTAMKYGSSAVQRTTIQRPRPTIPASQAIPQPETTTASPAPPATTHNSGNTSPAAGNATGPSATGPTTAPTQQQPVEETADDGQDSSNPFQALFQIYAQYEYLRQRYYQRQAAVTMHFNPYVVPGFPCMLFDSMRTRFHVVGYVQNINHSWSASGQIQTQVSMVAVRTFPEFMNDVRNDVGRYAGRVTSAPAEPISEIRQVIQDEGNAEVFYQRLFYGGARPGNLAASINWTTVMGYSDGTDVIDIEITGRSVSDQEAELQVAREAAAEQASTDDGEPPDVSGSTVNAPNTSTTTVATPPTTGVTTTGGTNNTATHTIDPNAPLSPKQNIYQDAFDNYDTAMQLCSRPVCTLTQYVRFMHGGRTINDLIGNTRTNAQGQTAIDNPDGPEVEDGSDEFAYAEVQETDTQPRNSNVATGAQQQIRGPVTRKSATYYKRIFRVKPGPGTSADTQHYPPLMTPPTDEERGFTDPPTSLSSTTTGVAANYPQARADWDAVLLIYRAKVRLLLRPST